MTFAESSPVSKCPSGRNAPVCPTRSVGPHLALPGGMTAVRHVRNIALILLTLGATSALAQTRAGTVTGVVSLPAPDRQQAAVPGVTLTLTCGDVTPRTEVSDADGKFRFEDPPPRPRPIPPPPAPSPPS